MAAGAAMADDGGRPRLQLATAAALAVTMRTSAAAAP